MINPDAIIRTNRRTLSLSISKKGELIVRAPKRLSLNTIYKFIEEKSAWIERKKKEFEEVNSLNLDIKNYKQFLLFGKIYNSCFVDGIKEVDISDYNFILPTNKSKETYIKLLQKFYIKTAKLILEKRLDYFAKLMNLNYTGYKIDNCKKRWGCCYSTGILKFNFRICMLPHKTIDYIIIHELAHLVEFNHSKNFYRIIESVMKDYKNEIKEIKKYNYLLELYR